MRELCCLRSTILSELLFCENLEELRQSSSPRHISFGERTYRSVFPFCRHARL